MIYLLKLLCIKRHKVSIYSIEERLNFPYEYNRNNIDDNDDDKNNCYYDVVQNIFSSKWKELCRTIKFYELSYMILVVGKTCTYYSKLLCYSNFKFYCCCFILMFLGWIIKLDVCFVHRWKFFFLNWRWWVRTLYNKCSRTVRKKIFKIIRSGSAVS